jgi:heme-degrading monooxygenase HmoA
MLHSISIYLRSLVKILVVGIFVIGLVLGSFTREVQAGKFMVAMPFASTNEVIEVAIYDSNPATQKTLIKSLKINNKLAKKAAGFKGLSILQSQDGKQVIMLSQWQDQASYSGYMSSQASLEYGDSKGAKSMMTPPEPTQVTEFKVMESQTAIAGATPALRGKEAVVRWLQLSPKNPADQSELQTDIAELLPSIFTAQPVPQSAILLQNTETADLALITNWNCSAMFEDVGKPQEIALGDAITEAADSTQDLYNVITIIPATVKKAKS